jgi:hypothetical protein
MRNSSAQAVRNGVVAIADATQESFGALNAILGIEVMTIMRFSEEDRIKGLIFYSITV